MSFGVFTFVMVAILYLLMIGFTAWTERKFKEHVARLDRQAAELAELRVTVARLDAIGDFVLKQGEANAKK